MIFDDTSLLDDLSNNNEENTSINNGSIREKRNHKMRENFFDKYKFMYSNNNKPSSISGSIKGIFEIYIIFFI